MGVPYCIVKDKSRLGTVVRRKTTCALALTGVSFILLALNYYSARLLYNEECFSVWDNLYFLSISQLPLKILNFLKLNLILFNIMVKNFVIVNLVLGGGGGWCSKYKWCKIIIFQID